MKSLLSAGEAINLTVQRAILGRDALVRRDLITPNSQVAVFGRLSVPRGQFRLRAIGRLAPRQCGKILVSLFRIMFRQRIRVFE